MTPALPDANTRWRCGGCGNLTRFDVTRTRRTTEFWHFDLAGDHRVEDSTHRPRGRRPAVTCRWCGRSDAVELVSRAEADASARRDRRPSGPSPRRRGPTPDRPAARSRSGAGWWPWPPTRSAAWPPSEPAGLAGGSRPSRPPRRARLAGSQIAQRARGRRRRSAHLVGDRRARAGARARRRRSTRDVAPAAADPVDLAAVAYLLRPAGWDGLVAAAGDRARRGTTGRRPRAATRAASTSCGASSTRPTEASRAARRRHREQVAALKAENADLRHKLGDARAPGPRGRGGCRGRA